MSATATSTGRELVTNARVVGERDREQRVEQRRRARRDTTPTTSPHSSIRRDAHAGADGIGRAEARPTIA